jgi:ribose transport system permease protein
VKAILFRLWAFIGLVVMCIALALMSEDFLTVSNLMNVVRQVTVNAILALGMSYVIISAGIDLSVGSVVALSGCLLALAVRQGYHPAVGVLVGLGAGSACGLVNGMTITRLRLPPFIATLGMMSVARGLAQVITGGYPVHGLPDGFRVLGSGYLSDLVPVRVLGFGYVLDRIPIPVLILIVCAPLAHTVLTHTRLGRYTYAIGGNESAAYLSGIRVATYKTAIYVICGAFAGLAGIISTARVGAGLPAAYLGYELDAIAAVVIGGASLFGGEGTILGAVIGALIIGVLKNGLNLMHLSEYWQTFTIGVVIIGAVTVERFRHRS